MKCRFLCALCLLLSLHSHARQKLTIRVKDATTLRPIAGATAAENNRNLAVSDSAGNIFLMLSEGRHVLTISCVGYESKSVTAPAAGVLNILLSAKQQELDEVTVIASTRNNQRIENAPMKVEVLDHEEIEEESTVKPASIASILADVSGVQVQQSSAVSGNANVRIQGLDGRYTQILRDGLPLFDGFSGGFGILSIPPLDLKQVELIKGSASTLYGGGAIGGLVNIISKKPADKQDAAFTLNQTSLKESDVNAFLSRRYKHLGYTFFGGYAYQKAVDVDKDGFSDVPHLHSVVIHPRLFIYPDGKTTITAGYTGTFENRKGGDMQVIGGHPDTTHRYFEKNSTARNSVELLVERNLPAGKKLELKNSLSSFDRSITTDALYVKGNQLNYYTELSLYIPYHSNSFVAGINLVGDRFKKRPSDYIPLDNFSNNTAGAFVQNTWRVKDNITIEAGLRDDIHNTYGNFILPRLALFYRLNEHWAIRGGVGFGYKTPNPLAPQIIDYPLEAIQPLPAGTGAEKSVGYNAEFNYKKVWDKENQLFINNTFFLTRVSNPVVATEQPGGDVGFSNADKPVVAKGFDTYIKALLDEWEIYAGYTFTIVERKYVRQNQFMPLTPRSKIAFTIVKDLEDEGWRIGIDGSYIGTQYRMDATQTPAYFFMAAMVEKKITAHISAVLNGENLFDFRQSRKEPLYTGAVSHPQFQPLWAPIDGRVFNVALKVKL